MIINVFKTGAAAITPGTGYKPGDILGLNPQKLNTTTKTYDVQLPTLQKEIQFTANPFDPLVKASVTAGGRTVQVGENGLILTSTDSTVWTQVPFIPEEANFVGVAYGAGVYVAVCAKSFVYVSIDAFKWERVLDNQQQYFDITFASGKFTATTLTGDLMVSADGRIWEQKPGTSVPVVNTSASFTKLSDYVNIGTPLDMKKVVNVNGELISIEASPNKRLMSSWDGINWSKVRATPIVFNDIAFGASVYVAVGDAGAVYTSSDAVTWTAQTSGTSANLKGIEYVNGQFVAAGSGGTVIKSTFGITWTTFNSLNTNNNVSSAYGNGSYVVITEDGVAVQSNDGVTFTNRDMLTLATLTKVIFNGSVFVAVGSGGAIVSSPDGIVWTERTSGVTADLTNIMVNGTTFVATGKAGTIVTSTDGTTWTARTSGTSQDLAGCVYMNSMYVAFSSNLIIRSADLVTWTQCEIRTSGTTRNLNATAYGAGRHVAVGALGRVIHSTDGVNWTVVTVGTADLKAVAYGPVGFTAVGVGGAGAFSADGITWQATTAGVAVDLVHVANCNGTFIAVGATGTCVTSNNGITWATKAITSWKSVAFGAGVFVAVSALGGVITTADGVTFADHSVGGVINRVAFINNVFVLVGNAGLIAYSTDGATWSLATSNTTANLYAVAYVGGRYLAVGEAGAMVRTTSLASWTKMVAADWEQVVYNGAFYAVGSTGQVSYSTDGQFWESITRSSLVGIRSLKVLNGITWAVGDNGLIVSGDMYAGTHTVHSVGGFAYNFKSIAYVGTRYYAITEAGYVFESMDGNDFAPIADNFDFSSVASSGTDFVAINATGEVFFSVDPYDWSKATTLATGTYNRVRYVNGRYVIVGNAGAMYTSTNGTTWTAVTTGLFFNINDITYQATANFTGYVLAGDAGGAATSTNLTSFSVLATGTAVAPNEVKYLPAAGLYIAMQLNGSGTTYYTSADGLNWTARTFPVDMSTVRRMRLLDSHTGINSYVRDTCIVITNTNRLYYTKNGTTWSSFTVTGATEINDIYQSIGYSFDGTTYTPTGSMGAIDDFSNYYTRNGSLDMSGSWSFNSAIGSSTPTVKSSGSTASAISIVANYYDGKILVLGATPGANSFNAIYHQSGGIALEWKIKTTLPYNVGGGYFSDDAHTIIPSSPDLANLEVYLNAAVSQTTNYGPTDGGLFAGGTAHPHIYNGSTPLAMTYTGPYTGIATNGTTMVAFGTFGKFAYSANTTSGPHYGGYFSCTGTNKNLKAITTTGAGVVAVGDDGTIIRSADTKIWFSTAVSAADDLFDITTDGTKSVAISSGTAYTTSDHASWASFAVTSALSTSYGNGNFVITGAAGSMLTSSNGATFTAKTSGVATDLYASTYGDGVHVALSIANDITTSPDASTFTRYQLNSFSTSAVMADMVYGTDLWLVGSAGFLARSPTGRAWQVITPVNANDLKSIAYGAGTYQAVGSTGTVLVNSGSGWSAETSTTAQNLNRVRYLNGQFFAVGAAGTTIKKTGSTWAAAGSTTGLELTDMAFNTGRYSAVGVQGNLMTAADAATWSTFAVNQTRSTGAINAITNSTTSFYIGGDSGRIMRSPNACEFVQATSTGTANKITGMAFSASLGIAYCATGGVVGIGSNGSTWTTRTSNTVENLNDIVVANGGFTAVGDNGAVTRSTNGTTWTVTSTGTDAMYGMAFGNSLYLLTGANGHLYTSAALATYSQYTVGALGTTQNLRVAGYGASKYVVLGDNGDVRTSNDLVVWANNSYSSTAVLRNMTFAGSKFVAVGDAGAVVTSANGTAWTAQTSNTTSNLKAVVLQGTYFVAIGDAGRVVRSADGVTWLVMNTPTTYNLAGLSSNGSLRCVAVGASGFSNFSDDGGVTWAVGSISTPRAGAMIGIVMALVGDNGLLVGSDQGGTIYTIRGVGQGSIAGATAHLRSLTLGPNAMYYAAGSNGAVYTTTDANVWTARTSGAVADINAVAVANGQLVIATAAGKIFTTPDAVTWTQRTSGTTQSLTSLMVNLTRVVASGGNGVVQYSTDNATWTAHTRTADSTSGDFNDISFAANVYLLVGAGGTIRYRKQNNVWFAATSNTTANLNGITKLGSIYVAVGDNGTIVSTTTPTTWTARSSGQTTIAFTQVTCNNSTFVAMGYGDLLMSSTDGSVWTARSGGVAHSYGTVTPSTNYVSGTYLSTVGRFVLVGGDKVSTSSNGTAWEWHKPNQHNLLMMINNGGFAFAYSDRNYGMQSIDGLTWTRNASLTYPGTSNALVFAYGNGIMVGVGQVTGGTAVILTSTDGITWTRRSSGITTNLYTVGFGGNSFVALGDYSVALTSTDGITWAKNEGATFNSVEYANGKFLAVGKGGVASSSVDGVVWTPGENDVAVDLNNSKVVNGKTFGIGDNGKIVWTTDGTHWGVTVADTQANLKAMAYGALYDLKGVAAQSIYVAVGDGGKILASPDGVVWTSRTSGTTANFTNVVYDTTGTGTDKRGFFVAVGNGGVVRTSTNTITWTAQTSGTTAKLNSILKTAGQYVVVGAGGKIISSTDGVTWTTRTSGTTEDLNDIAFDGTNYFVVGTNGVILKSTDAVTWTAKTSNATADLYSVAFGGGRVMTVGASGTVRVSVDQGTTWTPAGVALPVLTTWTPGTLNPNGLTLQGGWRWVSESNIPAVVTTTDGAGAITGVSMHMEDINASYKWADVSGTLASTATIPGHFLPVTPTFARQDGRVRMLDLSNTANQYTTMPAAVSGGIFGQYGFRVFDTDATGAKVLVAKRAAEVTTFNQGGSRGTNQLAMNLENAPSGDNQYKHFSQSVFPMRPNITANHAAVKTVMVDSATGAVAQEFDLEFAKMSNDGNMVVGWSWDAPTGNAGHVKVYVNTAGTWGVYQTFAFTNVTGLDFATLSKNAFVVKTSTTVEIYKNSGSGFAPWKTVASEFYADFINSKAYGHKVVYGAYAPFGNVRMSENGDRVVTLGTSHFNNLTVDNENKGAYPLIFWTGNLASDVYVERTFWQDYPATFAASTPSYVASEVGVQFYSNGVSGFTFDITPDAMTVVVARKLAHDSATIEVMKSHYGDAPWQDTNVTTFVQQYTLPSLTNMPIRLNSAGTRFTIGGMYPYFTWWVKTLGIGADTLNHTSNSGHSRRGSAAVFSKDGSKVFFGDFLAGTVTAGVNAQVAYTWTISKVVFDDAGSNINTLTLSFSGGDAVAQCPDIVTNGVGTSRNLTTLWPRFTAAGGGVYTQPATISIYVKAYT